MKAKRVVGWVVALSVLGGVALVGGKAVSLLNRMSSNGGPPAWPGVLDPEGQFPKRDRVNILLIGKDYNHTNKGILYTKNSRSDTLILLSLDIKNRSASALSIPRDTYVASRHGKINAAYAQGGATLAMKTVGDLLGVQPDYHIALKPDAVKTMVDAVGGVTVESKGPMKYDDNWGGLHIDLPAGKYEINGEQAVGFTRFRKSNPGLPHSLEETDERRMARQQQLIKAMVAKAKQPQNLLQHGDELIKTALASMETDLKPAQLAAIATMYKSVQPEQIKTASLIGKDGRVRGLYVFQPNTDKTKALVDWLVRGDESAVNRLTVVAVQNGTEVAGAARKVADLLKVEGYDAQSTGNASLTQNGEELTTRITYRKAAVADRAARIAQLLGGGTVIKEALPIAASPSPTPSASAAEDDKDAPDVVVVLGRDLAPSLAQREARL